MAETKRQKNTVSEITDKSEEARPTQKRSLAEVRRRAAEMWQTVRRTDWKKIKATLRQYVRKMRPPLRKAKKMVLKVMSHWKFITVFLPSFLFFYYFWGSMIAENIDVTTEYKLPAKHLPMFETADSMAFLIRREVDKKMWTPNLPPVFPASILDNMPNFQIGIVFGVKDMTSAIRRFKQNTEAQQKDIDKAYKLLSYPPNVWLMSRRGKFNLAPSSNAQYRKAAKMLNKFVKDGVFAPNAEDLDILLRQISKKLQKITEQNETGQREKAAAWADTSSDDLFYYGKGYAFALWQITNSLGVDFKEVILEKNLYVEWTYLMNSLKKAAEFKPLVVRNGAPDSLWTPNHLIMQNFYLQRAIIAAEKIRDELLKENHADQTGNT